MTVVPSRPAVLVAPEDVDAAQLRWLMSGHRGERLPTLDELLHRPEWHAYSACIDEPVETFFPRRGEPTARARAICAGCTVRDDCLAFAMAEPDLAGIWAGTSQRQRRRMAAGGERRSSAVHVAMVCGTRNGAERHRRLGEPVCDPCRQASIEYKRAWRAQRATA